MSPKQLVPDLDTLPLFPDIPTPEQLVQEMTFRSFKSPVWSHQKARLIEKYLYFFVMITKHGTYIDGFSGPQAPDVLETWSAKRVIESRPRYLRNFFLCELDAAKVDMLKSLWDSQPPKEKKEAKRTCRFYQGDFNEKVDEILASGEISEKQATFALLDQRTFECRWSTVVKLARHKQGNKIELFYFLAVKWLHRSLSGLVANPQTAQEWWGRDDWQVLRNKSQNDICALVCERFKSELGYKHAFPFPIWEAEAGGGSIMYYMIHATDHDQAPGLMWRAYNQAIGPHVKPDQGSFEGF